MTKPRRRARRPAKTKPSTTAQKRRAQAVYRALLDLYPEAHCELNYRSPHELLIATILSAQATDVSVNKATPALFARFPTPADYANATPAEIEPYISAIGLFRGKAKSIHESMKRIVEVYHGTVPATMTDLLTLRGVARKTANVVLGNAFGINEGIVVDTHVARLAQRLGLSRHTDPARIERDLMSLFPRAQWTMLPHLLIFHGRRVCKARGGACATHPFCGKYCSNARAASSSAVPGARHRRGSRTPRTRRIDTLRPRHIRMRP